jgi:release factor glutamine methyltransferase
MMTLDQWLSYAYTQIDRRDAQVLAQHVLQLSRAQLITQGARIISPGEHTIMSNNIISLINKAPMAYITGSKAFYGLDFEVNPAVLVPRPETELLVDAALAFLASMIKKQPAVKVLDLGTGSGCIAVSIAHEAQRLGYVAAVTAIDASKAALEVAACNNARLAQGQVRLLHSDWFSALANERFDLIVSNPPYIVEGDVHLQALKHEPIQALTSGADGLDAIRLIISQAPQHLQPGGMLWLEHGYNQAPAVRALLTQGGFSKVHSQRDLAQIERISGAALA